MQEQWSWSNIATVAALIVVAIIEAAQQSINQSPDLSSRLPEWVTSSDWNYIPLALLTIAGVLWIIGNWPKRRGNPHHVSEQQSLQDQILLKDAIIEAKVATIDALKTRLDSSNTHIQESVSAFERHPSSEEVIAEIRNLRNSLRASEEPLLELQPELLVVNPLGRATSRILIKFRVRNLGGATSFFGWQASVKLPTHSVHVVQGALHQKQRPEIGRDLDAGVNFAVDDRMLQKGEGRTGWIEFVVVGDAEKDGNVLQVQQVIIRVADYTNRQYLLEIPPTGLLPPPLPPAKPGKPPTIRIDTLSLPKKTI